MKSVEELLRAADLNGLAQADLAQLLLARLQLGQWSTCSSHCSPHGSSNDEHWRPRVYKNSCHRVSFLGRRQCALP